jgi:beta-lactam-binding protein with PASTA domain/tRNA A-37 threonylcarbamoyl transferase component Bud32
MIDPETIIDGRYLVISRIGSGGMAEVYLAKDQLLGRQVAVKVLHQRFVEDQEFVERFRREASSAASLSHPNVVAIFDRGEWNGTYYIAMEYLPGRSLKTVVREHGPLDPPVAIDIVIQILHAARFAHRRGIIHRDLKPQNVILDDEGRAKVTDFGIARAGASDMTLTGSIMGTAQYLSPEQAQGQPVSAATDLYAIGIVLYELLTGRIPFDGETAVSIALKQVSAAPPVPSSVNPAVSGSLDAVVRRALAKNPADRFVDADEFIAALEQIKRDGLLEEPRTQIVGPAASGDESADTPGATGMLPPLEADGDKRSRGLWIGAATLLIALALVAALLLLLPGTSRVAVPNVVGQSRVGATARLQEAGLTPRFSSADSSTVPDGSVISTSPTASAQVRRNSAVQVVLSGGPGSSALPEVAGLTRDRAVAVLKHDGFKPSVEPQASSTTESGFVISTSPSAGTDVQIGSPVSVIVSSGPAHVNVPSVTGQSLEEAEASLTAASLKVGTITQQPSATKTPGSVLSQSPLHDSSVAPGTAVNLTVAETPQQIAVPNVLGKKRERAEVELEAAGFTPKALEQTVSGETENGVVLKQSPAGAKRVKRGAIVTVTIGVFESPTSTTLTTTTSTTTTSTAAPAPAATPGQ